MTPGPLERLDSYPYRHRISDVMTAPAVCIPGELTVMEAARIMTERGISSVVVPNITGRVHGILTEHDVLKLVAYDPQGLQRRVCDVMTAPVHTIPADALLYRALARMARLGVRHLPAVDGAGRPVGILTARALLKQRTSLALTLGDEIEHASDAASLRAARDKLPALAAGLRREDVPATQIATVIAGVICDLTARAAELALAHMRGEGRGEAPATWCLLVLGSAGRGESLLAGDQDNALVHDGEPQDDAWFAAFGKCLNDLLDQAGVPRCRGGVMVDNASFRLPLPAWRAVIDDWVTHPSPEALLNVDVFYDFVPAFGDRELANALRRHASDAAAGSPVFLRLMAAAGEGAGSPFDLLGRLRTKDGRIDLKRFGLFPVVSAARAIALAWRCTATGTDERLMEAVAKGALASDVAEELTAARGMIVETILDQQLADIEAGRPPGNDVEPRRLSRAAARRLRQALDTLNGAPDVVKGALTAPKARTGGLTPDEAGSTMGHGGC